MAQATPINLDCAVDLTRQVGASTVPGRPPAQLATIRLYRIPARGVIDLQLGRLFIHQHDGVVLFNGTVAALAYSSNQSTFQALYRQGNFAGTFLLGVMRGRDVLISLQPPPLDYKTFTVRCRVP
jgi:hypothetical protein